MECARLQKYGRFGMEEEEARFTTPDRFQTAYDEYVRAVENDRTPSLSPKSAVADDRHPRSANVRSANVTQKHPGSKATMKNGLAFHKIEMGSDLG